MLCGVLCGGTRFGRLVSPAAYQRAARGEYPYFYLISGRVFFYLKLALVAALVLASPVIFLQIWRFVAPGLYYHEKRVLLPFVAVSSLCFIGGALFGYFFVFPPAFRFLIGYSNAYLEAMPAVEEYFPLALRLFLAFGAIFELPVLMVFLGKIGMVDRAFLVKNRKYAVLVAFVVAAILTPTPDVVNQLLMAGPIVLLYEFSILAVAFFARRPFRGYAAQEEKAGEDS